VPVRPGRILRETEEGEGAQAVQDGPEELGEEMHGIEGGPRPVRQQEMNIKSKGQKTSGIGNFVRELSLLRCPPAVLLEKSNLKSMVSVLSHHGNVKYSVYIYIFI